MPGPGSRPGSPGGHAQAPPSGASAHRLLRGRATWSLRRGPGGQKGGGGQWLASHDARGLVSRGSREPQSARLRAARLSNRTRSPRAKPGATELARSAAVLRGYPPPRMPVALLAAGLQGRCLKCLCAGDLVTSAPHQPLCLRPARGSRVSSSVPALYHYLCSVNADT